MASVELSHGRVNSPIDLIEQIANSNDWATERASEDEITLIVAGQWTDYVVAKLKDWQNGTTWGEDDRSKIMPQIAKRLSEQDINAVASYAEGLHTAKPVTTASAK